MKKIKIGREKGRKFLSILLVICLLICVAPFQVFSATGNTTQADGPDFALDSVLVTIKHEYSGLTLDEYNVMFADMGFIRIKDLTAWTFEAFGVRPNFKRILALYLEVPGEENVLDAIRRLNQLYFVDSASPDHYLWPLEPGPLTPMIDWNVGPAGESRLVTVTSSTSWSYSKPTWLAVSIAGPVNGTWALTLTAPEYPVGATRSGTFRVTINGEAHSFTVTQAAGAAPYLRVSPTSWYNVPRTGGAMTFTVESNVDWTVSVSSFMSTNVTSGSKNGTFTLTVPPSPIGLVSMAYVFGTGGAFHYIGISQF